MALIATIPTNGCRGGEVPSPTPSDAVRGNKGPAMTDAVEGLRLENVTIEGNTFAKP